MKKLIFSIAIIGITFTSCEKDDTTAPVENPAEIPTSTPPGLTTVLAQDSSFDGTNSTVRKFSYNANKMCTKVEYKYNASSSFTSHDTLIYDSEGKVVAVYKYVGTTLNDSAICTYVNEQLTQVVSTNDTAYFEYNGDDISKAIHHFVDASLGYRRDTVSSIVYENNNVKNYLANGVSVTATTDFTALNPYYGSLVTNSIFDLINQNNLTSLYFTSYTSILPISRTYTYNSDGRVATFSETRNDYDLTTNPMTVITTNTNYTLTYKTI